MPSLRFNQGSIAAGGTVLNLLTGSKFEYLPQPAAVVVYGTADAAGLQLELTFGNVIECDQMEVPILAGAGPNVDQHRLAAGVGAAGDRIQARLQNTSAVAIAASRFLFEIRPL